MKCPLCNKPLLRGQTAVAANGLEFHSGCYANALIENTKRQTTEWDGMGKSYAALWLANIFKKKKEGV